MFYGAVYCAAFLLIVLFFCSNCVAWLSVRNDKRKACLRSYRTVHFQSLQTHKLSLFMLLAILQDHMKCGDVGKRRERRKMRERKSAWGKKERKRKAGREKERGGEEKHNN